MKIHERESVQWQFKVNLHFSQQEVGILLKKNIKGRPIFQYNLL